MPDSFQFCLTTCNDTETDEKISSYVVKNKYGECADATLKNFLTIAKSY